MLKVIGANPELYMTDNAYHLSITDNIAIYRDLLGHELYSFQLTQ
jgi:hypothetical protein